MNRSDRVRMLLATATLLMSGCRKDEGPMYIPDPHNEPGVPFDTAHFASEVQPIFTAHCWVCHPPTLGMDLGEGQAYASLVNVTSTNYAPAKRIVPHDPGASVLWQKVTGGGGYGLAMPPNGTTLSVEELETIRDWIEQGALDN